MTRGNNIFYCLILIGFCACNLPNKKESSSNLQTKKHTLNYSISGEKFRAFDIFTGKGINDCVCGRSKKMPGCDGSHNKP